MGIEHELFNKRAKGINSDAKGKKNELALAKALTEWVGVKFHRVPSSGGLGWGGTVGDSTVGDLICEAANLPFTIETKHYRAIGIKSSTKTLRVNSMIFKFWAQANREGMAANKLPLLIVRQNGMPKGFWWVFCDAALMTVLTLKFDLEPKITTNPEVFIYGYTSEDIFKLPYTKLETYLIPNQ